MRGNFCNQESINEASDQTGIPKFLLRKIEDHWHSFVLKTITSGSFENISIPHFVKFEFNKRKMDAINLSIANRKLNK